MNLTNAAACLKPFYPKACKASLSLALRPEETGVQLTPKAKRILFGSPAPRKRPCSVKVRVTEEDKASIHEVMKEYGCETEQDFLAYLIDTVIHKMESAPSEDEADPIGEKKGDRNDDQQANS